MTVVPQDDKAILLFFFLLHNHQLRTLNDCLIFNHLDAWVDFDTNYIPWNTFPSMINNEVLLVFMWRRLPYYLGVGTYITVLQPNNMVQKVLLDYHQMYDMVCTIEQIAGGVKCIIRINIIYKKIPLSCSPLCRMATTDRPFRAQIYICIMANGSTSKRMTNNGATSEKKKKNMDM